MCSREFVKSVKVSTSSHTECSSYLGETVTKTGKKLFKSNGNELCHLENKSNSLVHSSVPF